MPMHMSCDKSCKRNYIKEINTICWYKYGKSIDIISSGKNRFLMKFLCRLDNEEYTLLKKIIVNLIDGPMAIYWPARYSSINVVYYLNLY